ncbi:hypothetical protein P879_05998 [Paragonimus westermani]|uniref:Diacylglycerol kinase n=1 Tax=Paragonimus westermani TaxID=34504 RepID=A0A8T0DP31_9TREM|nr:hypothetical protein P879_05998 [Paragonimus westermani]
MYAFKSQDDVTTLRDNSETASQCTLALSGDNSASPSADHGLTPREILANRNLIPGTALDCDSGYNRSISFIGSPSRSAPVERTNSSDGRACEFREKPSPFVQSPTHAGDKRAEYASSVQVASTSSSLNRVSTVEGHSFIRRNLHKPACCHHCGEVIWGILSTGFQCEICNVLTHERCYISIYTPCITLASILVQSPASHCWSDPIHFKRKFCNVCRKRLEDSLSVRCEDGRENKLNVNANFRSQLRFDLKQPSILLRAKEPQESQITVRVYAGDLGHILPPNAALYEEVLVDASTTSTDVVNKAMEKFGCGHLASDDCYLTSVCMDGTVTERHLADDELLVAFLSQLRQESARVYQLTRLELRFVEDSLSTNRLVSVFVGNLKENLSQRLYECILLDKLGEECRWDTIDAIYYESGCLVLTYRSSEKAERAYDLLKDSVLMDKQLTALLLPTIHPKLIPPDVQPLLVFVNLKSGGCQGMDLIVAFRRLLNPFQVFNLDYGGPLPGLYCFRHLTSYKILICGGDGTVGWTLSCLDIVGQDAACNSPPIAPLPLGTGNDLARVLRWGSGYSSAEDPLAILKDVVAAEEVQLDRWTFVVRPDEEFKDEAKLALENQNNASNTNEDNSIMIIMNNYFGIGIDADLSLDFHNARSENPSKFNSRIHNKGVYFKIGLRKMINRTACKDLHKQIVVVADGKLLLLPPIEGLIVLNIHSWGGGANPWGVEKDDVFVKPTHYDGLLEVVGISGVVHMGQIYSGLGTGIRLTQAGHLKILLKTELPIQIDGEPFIHPAGQIVVLRSALRATMLRKVKRIKRRTMEITLPAEAGRLTTQQSMQPDTLETTTNTDRPSSSSPLSTPPVGIASSGSFVLFDPNWSPCQTASSEGEQRGKSEKSTVAPSRVSNSTYPMAGDSSIQPGNEKMSDTPLLPPCLLTGDDGVEAPILHSLSLKSSNGSGIPSGSKSM